MPVVPVCTAKRRGNVRGGSDVLAVSLCPLAAHFTGRLLKAVYGMEAERGGGRGLRGSLGAAICAAEAGWRDAPNGMAVEALIGVQIGLLQASRIAARTYTAGA